MKMNKLAAGALALALGLGAVAPAVAAEPKTGTELVAEDYNEALALANKFYFKKKEAAKAVEVAKARVEAAKKAVEVAEKAYKNAPKDAKSTGSAALQEEADKIKKDELIPAVTAVEGARAALKKAEEADPKKEEDVEAAKKTLAEKNTALLAATAKYESKLGEVAAALEKEKAEADNVNVNNKLTPKQQALVDLVKAQNELAAANGAYGTAVSTEKAVSEKYSNSGNTGALDKLKAAAAAAGAIVKIENDKVVVKPSIKDKEQFKKDNIEELKRAREEALTAIKAVKLLKELSPEKIKNVEAKLNKLVAKNEELVKKADAKIAAAEKKMAFIATAYAAEEADDTDALIKELDSTTSEIKELIKDKPEEKKPEEKKPEEKKPEEKTPSKKAGNNARTGIAGVAGVAGILAAASVAYAASKRD